MLQKEEAIVLGSLKKFKTAKFNPLNEGLLTEDFFSIIYKVKSSFDAS